MSARTWLLVASATLGVLGCSAEVVDLPPPPPVDWASLGPRRAAPPEGPPRATFRERGVADSYAAALGSPHFEALGALLDDDAHFAFAGFYDVHGRGNVVASHEVLLGGVEARRLTSSRVLITDSAQVLEWVMTGTDHASKSPLSIRGLSLLWTKDDGSVRDVHLYFDQALLDAERGHGPETLRRVPPPAVPPTREIVEQSRSKVEGENLKVVRSAIEALDGNESAYLAAMADDVEIQTLESAEPLRGMGAARAYFRSLQRAIGGLDAQIDNAWAIGSSVVVEYHIVGEQRAPIGWVPMQRDNLFKMFVVDVVELRAGRIARIRRYDNPMQLIASPLP